MSGVPDLLGAGFGLLDSLDGGFEEPKAIDTSPDVSEEDDADTNLAARQVAAKVERGLKSLERDPATQTGNPLDRDSGLSIL